MTQTIARGGTARCADRRNRAAFLPVPGFALHALYGGMAQLVITGQRVGPARLARMRFGFRYPRLEPALLDA